MEAAARAGPTPAASRSQPSGSRWRVIPGRDTSVPGAGNARATASRSTETAVATRRCTEDVGGQSFFSSKTHTPVMFWLSSLPSRTATATFVESPWAPYWALKNTLPGTVR